MNKIASSCKNAKNYRQQYAKRNFTLMLVKNDYKRWKLDEILKNKNENLRKPVYLIFYNKNNIFKI